MIVGRFAPSPSGRMHLGNVFTALIAWLSVRKHSGKMLLRIEDLDPDRSKREYIQALYDDLKWLGLDWDEEMPHQSTRSEVYGNYFKLLPTYPCFCTRSELHAASAPHASDGRVIYSGTCRNLSDTEREMRKKSPSWRTQVSNEMISFIDGVFGRFEEDIAAQWGDFIVRRSDGVYAYQLAVVCDDALGGVTQVVRGCDLLSATIPQLWLYQQFNLTPPEFYHVPLLVAPDGRRLSKREKDLDMSRLRKKYTAQELIGRLAYAAGLIEKSEAVSANELIGQFSWTKISRDHIVIGEEF